MGSGRFLWGQGAFVSRGRGFRCSALLNDELAPYTRSPSTVPRVYSVHQKPAFYTEFPFGTVEACFEHGELLKMRRVPQKAVLSTECPFRTVGGRFRYRMPQTVKMRKGITGLGPAAQQATLCYSRYLPAFLYQRYPESGARYYKKKKVNCES